MNPAQPTKTLQIEQLPINVYNSNEDMGKAAAWDARVILQEAIAARGEANIILATGNSQLTFLHALRDLDGIDWSCVNVFHMECTEPGTKKIIKNNYDKSHKQIET